MEEDRGNEIQVEDDDMRRLLISWTERGDVAELTRFIFSVSNASINFQRNLLLYSTYDDYGSTLLQIAVENGHTEVVELLLSHEQYNLGQQADEARWNLTPRLEVVSRVLLLVYYLNTQSQSTLFRLSQSYPDSTIRDYVLASGIESKTEPELVAEKSMYSIDAPFVQRLIGFMSKYSIAVPPSQNDDVRHFIGDQHLLASYDEVQDPRHIVLLWAFASSAKNDRFILDQLKKEFKGAFDLFNRIFSDREGEPSSATKDLNFFFARLVQALKFEMLHARSQLKFDTALHTATLTQRAEMANILLQHYDILADPDDGSCHFLDVYSMTPLHYAVMLKSEPLIEKLLHNSTYVKHVNARDWCLRTPLHLACASALLYEDPASTHKSSPMQLKVVRMLVNNDCSTVDLNAKDCCGFTPLHWAVHVRALEVVRFLLRFRDRSGDRTVITTEKDVDDKTLLQHAMEHTSTSDNGGQDLSSRAAKKKEIERLLMSQPGVKDEIDIMYRDRQVYVDAANAILVGAALIASVTYGGWLQPPQGDQDQLNLARLRLFWGFNSLSFFSAIATVMAGAGAVLPMADVYIEEAVQRVRDWLALTSLLLVISVTFVLGAFAAAGFVSQSQYPSFGDNMASTTVTGSLLCFVIGLLFLRALSRVNNEWPWLRLIKWARRLYQQSSGIFGYKVKVKCTLRDLDLKGGNAHVWHRHFAILIAQILFPGDIDKRLVIHTYLRGEPLHALIQSWAVLIDDFQNRKYGWRPVLPACAHDHQFVGDRGVQHAIMHMPSTNYCRQACLARDCILLRDIRSQKKMDIKRLFGVFNTFVQWSVR